MELIVIYYQDKPGKSKNRIREAYTWKKISNEYEIFSKELIDGKYG